MLVMKLLEKYIFYLELIKDFDKRKSWREDFVFNFIEWKSIRGRKIEKIK